MKLNISIDDVSPHPLSSIKVLDRCFDLIKEFPDIKFSLFVPIAYWRTMKIGTTTEKSLNLDLYPDFCNQLINLPSKNFEICYHGYYHGIPGKTDNDEFQYLNFEEAIEKFELMFNVVEKAGLKDFFKPIFRPPAWRMSSEAIKAAKTSGIKLLALSSKDYAKQTYRNEDTLFENVVYFTCNPPFDPLSENEINELVYHACEWDKNYLSENLKDQLKIWLYTFHDNIEFKFLDELIKK